MGGRVTLYAAAPMLYTYKSVGAGRVLCVRVRVCGKKSVCDCARGLTFKLLLTIQSIRVACALSYYAIAADLHAAENGGNSL